MIAHISVTTHWIVFIFGTWYACNISFDMICLSVVAGPLGRAQSQLLNFSVGQIRFPDKVSR